MSESDVVYADVKIKDKRRPQGKNYAAASSENDTTYSEVRIHKSQQNDPPKEPCDAGSAAGSKVTRGGCNPEKVALVVLCVALAAAAVGLSLLYNDNVQTKQQLQALRADHDAVKKNLTDTLSAAKPCNVVPPSCKPPTETCQKCEPGWELHGQTCYRFLDHALNWESSRNSCKNLGGDLVKIDNRDEQAFLEWTLTKKMDWDEDKFWIGLTDQEHESQWVWVDGSALNSSSSYWRDGEPDDWKGGTDRNGEDCARMGERGGTQDLKCWFDKSCKADQKGICEKPATTGVSKCV